MRAALQLMVAASLKCFAVVVTLRPASRRGGYGAVGVGFITI